jgi:uncharacterized protein (TIGR01777 family)
MKGQIWLVTGATGLVGTALCEALLAEGHEVRALGRGSAHPRGTHPFTWNLQSGKFPEEALEGVDVVVHLAAASVGQRWTEKHKAAILNSRVQSTSLLKAHLLKAGFAGTWIQASAIGIYGNHSAPCDENTSAGTGFLAEVAQAWEQASLAEHVTPSYRLVHMRLGLVLSPNGGTLDKLLPIYRMGLGAPLGSGSQPMGWIHIDDVVQFILWAASNEKAHGAFNVVAPEAASNKRFSSCLAMSLNRPHWAPAVPAFALKLAMGSMSSLLLEGQNATPSKLQQGGFAWQHPTLSEALTDCVS